MQKYFTGTKWFVEGDIKGCFDNVDHHVLIAILRKRIADEYFIGLLWKFLKAGYMEDWNYHNTYSGTPQGSIISPILANIYMNELDSYMAEYAEKFNCGNRRKINPAFKKKLDVCRGKEQRLKRNISKMSVEEKEGLIAEIRELRRSLKSIPYSDQMDDSYKRLCYIRYADDFLIGVIGSKEDAEQIKQDVGYFIRDKLHLEMSEEKTKVTHSSKPVRYLGYDFKVIHSKNMKRCKNGDMKRVWYGKVFLYMPKEKWIKKAMERGAIQVKRNNDTGKEMWRPMPRKDLMNRSDAEIVSTFNSEIRGLYNFYRIAENVGALHKYYYMVRYSMLKTLAGKHRTNVSVIKKRHMVNGVLRIPYDTTKGRKYCEFYHDGFRKHSDGYDNVADVMPSYRKYDSRHTIVNRIKAGVCEICGEHADYLCMHHVRTLKSLKGRDIFEQKMLKMRRKSLALCPDCFELLHETKESR